jgi:hypothetical protein
MEQLIQARCNVDLEDMDGRTPLHLAARVVINGLVANPELNGRTGTALSFYSDKGRYAVKLDQPSTPLMSKPCDLFTTVSTAALCYMKN